MPASGAARQESPYAPPPPVTLAPVAASHSGVFEAVLWAMAASTWHRVRRGEGALLAINFSLIALQTWQGGDLVRGAALAVVSTLAIGLMYAFNDLHDAPADWTNPKKDRRLIAIWVEQRGVGMLAIVTLKVVTLSLALATIGPRATAAVAAVMVVNVAYSMVLKGAPIADIVIVWLWGALYAAIVSPSVALVFLVGVMTGVCHLFQALGDRDADAANGIDTTAVHSTALARDVLIVLGLLLAFALYGSLGVVGAVSAVLPLLIFFAVADAAVGWLLTKGYFAIVWLAVLGAGGAAV